MTKKQAMPYMKLYTTYLDDMDFIELERNTRSRYWDFYLLAWNADAGGDLLNRETGKALTIKNLALRLREEAGEITRSLEVLEAAGFMSKDGDIWHITRYAEEQDNQDVMRKSWSERQAKHRNKSTQPNEDESQANETELNGEERIIESISQSNRIKLKSHMDVTRDSRVENNDGATDGPIGANAYSYSSSGSNSKADAGEPLGIHPDLHALSKIWQIFMGAHISPFAQRLINKGLYDGLDPDAIAEKIETTAIHEPTNPLAYFAECIRELYPDEP